MQYAIMKKALFSVLLAAAAVLPAQAQQRNILLIIADDLGSDSFPLTASAGASLPPMPNISALKNSGVLFRNTYAQPTCSPTRATILTGRYTFRTGIGQQVTAASGQLTAAEFTLPEAFAANPGLNYSLAMFGKWHLNAGAGSNDTPRTFGGWPHFAGTISGALPDYSNWTKVTNNVTSTVTSYATTELTNDVIAWIASRPAGTPWFAWAAYNAPHTPFHFPPAHLHSFGAAAATDRNQYEAMCEALDTEVGRLLAAVNLANTHVIFIGDNGTPGSVIQTPYTNAHSKGGLYEGGVRVPMIIAGPDVVSPNRNHDGPVHSVDLYSTILELAGINASTTQPAANPIDSTSLLPILKNTVPVSRTVFSQVFGPDYTTTAGRVIKDASGYTLLQYDDGREELYNIATSPNQTSNLLGTSITSAAQSAYAAMKLQLANYSVTGIPNEPLVHSWFTQNSGRYARIYETDASQSAQTAVTTWNRGAGVQTLPVYAGVQQEDYSGNRV